MHLAEQHGVALGDEIRLDLVRQLHALGALDRLERLLRCERSRPRPRRHRARRAASTRARVSSDWVSRVIRSASSARRSRKRSRASGSSLAPPRRTSIAAR